MGKTSSHGPEALFQVLADETRLRIIRALLDCPLTAGELTEVLGLPQSTVSRHLGVLRRGDMVHDRREGTFIWYSLSDGLLHNEPLVAVLRAAIGGLPQAEADRDRQAAALEARRARTQDFFDSLAGSYHNLAQPGGGAEGLAVAMSMALPPSTIVDLGAGEGDITLRLARLGHRVIAVDSSRAMVRTLDARARAAGIEGIEAHVGDLESLPLTAEVGDVVLLSQTLHHTRRPEVALREATRVARPGGHVVVLDLVRHEQEWVRERLGDLWLGFDPATLTQWLSTAGLLRVVVETVEVAGGLPVVAARGTKPGIEGTGGTDGTGA